MSVRRKKKNIFGAKQSVSPIRTKKMLELKSEIQEILKRNPEGLSKKEILFELFKDKKDILEGYSYNELCLWFYEKEVEKHKKTGQLVPTTDAKKKLVSLIYSFRNKWKPNKSVKVYADVLPDQEKGVNYWIIYRMVEERKTKNVQKRMDKVSEGVQEKKQELIDVTRKTKKEIQKLDDELTQKIAKKSRKKEMNDLSIYA